MTFENRIEEKIATLTAAKTISQRFARAGRTRKALETYFIGKGIAANASSAIIFANINLILMLNVTNFKVWKENILIVLGYMDLNIALRTEQPQPLTADSIPDAKKEYERWEHSNHMSLMIISRGIPEAFRGTKSEGITKAKDFISKIEKRFAKHDKIETSTLLAYLIWMKYKGKGNIREYIMEMSHIASKLKALKLDLCDELVVHLVLLSLPAQFN
ncbi:uncharacterized protein LOC109830898 [Asparagus officinalis]|uniref:uncharacterized protein LOC109830898 n=1 Tax=Asparagus officinalis TaxID=4686 RepID=UPI00098DEFBF|nr:uncharacterized protein LOC109830898 [Asparagus officinalis]